MTEVLFAGLFLSSANFAQADPFACQTRRDLAGPCREVVGDLQLFDGTPSARIKEARSGRTLGVTSAIEEGNEVFVAPKAVRDHASFDNALRGRYQVCPLEKASAGRMQTVCIERGARLRSIP